MKNEGFAMSNTALGGGNNVESGYRSNSKKHLLISLVVIVILLAAVIALAVLYANKDSDSNESSGQTGKNKGTDSPTSTASPSARRPTPTRYKSTSPRKTTLAPTKQTTSPSVNCSQTPTDAPPPGQSDNPEGPYNEAAVSADDVRCSEIGVNILKKNGSAVDAAIAALFCIGVVNMHSAGIGGGAVMVVYIKKKRTAEYFNFRERAPGLANESMFVNDTTSASKTGGLAIAVPGEVKGMYEAHKKYGKLKWKELVKPAMSLAREGFTISKALDKAIRSKEKEIRKLEGLKELLLKEDGCLKRLGDRLVNRKLAVTLERISCDPTSFYNGSLAKDIVNDIDSNRGIITAKDLNDYNVEVEPALNASVGDYQLHTSGLPSSGILIAFMLNVLKGYDFTLESVSNNSKTANVYHKIIETFKYAYARRALLGDKNFLTDTQIIEDLLDEDYAERIRKNITDQTYPNASHYGGYYANYDAPGTSHLSVLAPNGDAVSVTSTINTYFGSKVRSTVTGITYNNEMDDFSTPGLTNAYGVEPSPSNFIAPGKRPMSSMSPIILTNRTSGDVVFIAGASGGTRITTGTALVTMNKIWFGRNTSVAVTMPRFHNQLLPNYTAIEQPPRKLSPYIIKELQGYGHIIETKSFYSVVQAISKELDGKIFAKSDPRKGGSSFGF
ncbi:glutathione hydrolase 1 proenzyme-like isoform X1 [Dendronephthya gigantea]|uniref:glutathione hydrolase 1 proenzyme-like isoform X1 n=1 Tax=Dendronephthya gigantea TaxID=151771 RepID=UPI00106BBE84|nr:glutathione hydrolase 1 proenzyme-like isoform X1 [Dendronephthya gigantea]